MAPPSRLAVRIDGEAIPEDEARSVWARFSEHMDAHPGDLQGFAKAEGFASVHPGTESGQAVLLFSRTEAQRPYGARESNTRAQRPPKGGQRSGGGSRDTHSEPTPRKGRT